MQLHELSVIRGRRKKRIGRGGKRGSYSGRGVKGQKSRAGRRIRPAERDLILRIPKLRGFKNKPKSSKAVVLNVGDLERVKAMLEKENLPAVVSREALAKLGFLPRSRRTRAKILGGGEIRTPITVSGIPVSESAKMKIEKAGGAVTRPNDDRVKSNA